MLIAAVHLLYLENAIQLVMWAAGTSLDIYHCCVIQVFQSLIVITDVCSNHKQDLPIMSKVSFLECIYSTQSLSR